MVSAAAPNPAATGESPLTSLSLSALRRACERTSRTKSAVPMKTAMLPANAAADTGPTIAAAKSPSVVAVRGSIETPLSGSWSSSASPSTTVSARSGRAGETTVGLSG